LVRFRQKTPKTEYPNLHGFELHRPSSMGTKLLLQVIKAIIIHPETRAFYTGLFLVLHYDFCMKPNLHSNMITSRAIYE